MTTERRQLVEAFSNSVRALGKAFWDRQAVCFTRFDLHPSQVRLLYFLNHKQSVSVKDVAQVFGFTSSAATQMVESLVKKGFVTRITDPTDRRKVKIVLSGTSRKKFEQFKAQHLAMTTKILSPLTNAELSSLIRIQHKVADHASKT